MNYKYNLQIDGSAIETAENTFLFNQLIIQLHGRTADTRRNPSSRCNFCWQNMPFPFEIDRLLGGFTFQFRQSAFPYLLPLKYHSPELHENTVN